MAGIKRGVELSCVYDRCLPAEYLPSVMLPGKRLLIIIIIIAKPTLLPTCSLDYSIPPRSKKN